MGVSEVRANELNFPKLLKENLQNDQCKGNFK